MFFIKCDHFGNVYLFMFYLSLFKDVEPHFLFSLYSSVLLSFLTMGAVVLATELLNVGDSVSCSITC